jgi:hypothetical protein
VDSSKLMVLIITTRYCGKYWSAGRWPQCRSVKAGTVIVPHVMPDNKPSLETCLLAHARAIEFRDDHAAAVQAVKALPESTTMKRLERQMFFTAKFWTLVSNAVMRITRAIAAGVSADVTTGVAEARAVHEKLMEVDAECIDDAHDRERAGRLQVLLLPNGPGGDVIEKTNGEAHRLVADTCKRRFDARVGVLSVLDSM